MNDPFIWMLGAGVALVIGGYVAASVSLRLYDWCNSAALPAGGIHSFVKAVERISFARTLYFVSLGISCVGIVVFTSVLLLSGHPVEVAVLWLVGLQFVAVLRYVQRRKALEQWFKDRYPTGSTTERVCDLE